MVFSSCVFLLLFLPLTLLFYYLVPLRLRNPVLLLCSLIFYGWGEPVYIFLMLFVILTNYGFGLLIEKQTENPRRKKILLTAAILMNLLLLGWFKYTGFSAELLQPLLPGLKVPEIRLPIGISFYIFQSLSYVIDVYRGTVKAQRDPVKLGTYVAMFPQLIAGPIIRYGDLAPQLTVRSCSRERFAGGVERFLIGLGKKVLLANQLAAMTEAFTDCPGTLCAWALMAAYTLQIYFDFSGYSDMAIGLGKMLGFEFCENFNYPYVSSSITDFWRRWHISLSGWFRDYVYIPLGGSRKGLPRQLRNLLIVWALTGLWHGASLNFLLWGLYYAILLIGEKLFLRGRTEKLPKALRRILTMLAVSLGWMLFRFEELPKLMAFLVQLVTPAAAELHSMHVLAAYLPVLLCGIVGSTPLFKSAVERYRSRVSFKCLYGAFLGAVFLLSLASVISGSYNPFIYFRF